MSTKKPEELTALGRRAAAVRPSAKQLSWSEQEMTMFVHFTVNTFTGAEWGSGRESEAVFNPTELEPRQWARVAAESGFKTLILTCKHHDGFCLWPSKYTSHSVANAPVRRDVVAETAAACREFGINFGVYLSPWDRHEPTYGDSPAYNAYYLAQMTELLTCYGPIAEVWLDTACGEGKNGRRQLYDWKAFYETVYRLQPQAVIFGGPDLRWIGNEAGRRRESEWSVVNWAGRSIADGVIPTCMREDIGSLEEMASYDGPEELRWMPAEVDTSIRPGWFYHEEEDLLVKPLSELVEIYFNSVGHNAQLLLNIPPDKRGKFHERDVARLRAFTQWRQEAFAHDLVATRDGLEFAFEAPTVFDCLELREDIAGAGQRVAAFHLEVDDGDGAWRTVARGTTIGRKELLRFPKTTALRGRVVIDECRDTPAIARIGAYLLPVLPPEPTVLRAESFDRENWQVQSAPRGEGSPENVRLIRIGGDDWHSAPGLPGDIVIDFTETLEIVGATLQPPQQGTVGHPFRVEAAVSPTADGDDFATVWQGELANTVNNPIVQTMRFGMRVSARRLRLRVLSTADGGDSFACCRINVLPASKGV